MNKIVGILTMWLFCHSAWAQSSAGGLVVMPSFSVQSQEEGEGVVSVNGSESDVDTRTKSAFEYITFGLGYNWSNGLYLGLQYLQAAAKQKYHETDKTGTDPSIYDLDMTTSLTGSAVSVGFLSANLKFILNYFVSVEEKMKGTIEQTSGATTQNIDISGESEGLQAYSLELAYGMNMGGLTVGPQISYLKHVYTDNKSEFQSGATSGVTESKGAIEKVRIIPGVVLWYMF